MKTNRLQLYSGTLAQKPVCRRSAAWMVCLGILWAGLLPTLSAQNYFVRTDGDDAAAGTSPVPGAGAGARRRARGGCAIASAAGEFRFSTVWVWVATTLAFLVRWRRQAAESYR